MDNGMLAWVSADHIPRTQTLPPAGPDQPFTLTVDAPHPTYGPLRFTFSRMLAKHHKSSHWFWVPSRAEQLDDTAPRPGHWLDKDQPTNWKGMPLKPGEEPSRR